MEEFIKYPKTPRLFREIIVTEKLDGENTTMYNDHIHARSLNSGSHPTRDWVKGLWGNIKYLLDEDFRICGENMYGKHTIHYKNLKSYFYVISMWQEDTCLSWESTVEMCNLMELTHVPVLYRGVFDYDQIRDLYKKQYENDPCEGYVIRLASGFKYEDFGKSVAKFVSSQFVLSNSHWMYDKVTPNELKK